MNYDFFEPLPKIIPVGKPTEFVLRGRYMQRQISFLTRNAKLVLETIPSNGLFADGTLPDWEEMQQYPCSIPENDPDSLHFTVTPEEEGEIVFVLFQEFPGGKRELVVKICVYALLSDLYALTPYRGDLHVHSSHSLCGSRDEDPKYVAARTRYLGLDFMALTDHIQYHGSEVAYDFIKSQNVALQLYHGEECHLLREHVNGPIFCINPVLTHNHIVSVGASQGVIQYSNDHFEEYQREVRRRADKISHTVDEEVRFSMAASDWVFDMIHKFGGIGIFAHPFWRTADRLNLPAAVREYIFESGKFDAIEVIGGANSATGASAEKSIEGKMRCLSWYTDLCIKQGRRIPIVGNTDSHAAKGPTPEDPWGLDLRLGTGYSIVFAENPTFEKIAAGIRAGRSVACMHMQQHPAQIFGDFRLVSYAYFLEREYFPEHNLQCRREGEKLLAALQHDADLKPENYGHLRG